MTCNLWEQQFSSKQKALTLTRKKTTCHTKSPTRPRRKCYSRRLKSGRIYIRICQSVGEQKFYLTKRQRRNNMISVAAAPKSDLGFARERSRATPVAYNSKSNRPAAASRHVALEKRKESEWAAFYNSCAAGDKYLCLCDNSHLLTAQSLSFLHFLRTTFPLFFHLSPSKGDAAARKKRQKRWQLASCNFCRLKYSWRAALWYVTWRDALNWLSSARARRRRRRCHLAWAGDLFTCAASLYYLKFNFAARTP